MKDGKFLTLGIESSCDETAAAVLADGRQVLSNVISTQIEIHKQYGGVVPEIASRHHLTNVNRVIEQALNEANVTMDQIDLVGVTYGPGLVGALVIGIAAAKAVSFATDTPLVGVNHMYGHVSSNFITYPELEPPFISLVVSGGHTNIIEMEDYTSCNVIGATRDDAAGEAYDKVARVIGLGYPGGPKIDKLAKEGNPDAIKFKRVWLEKDSYDFSFSGLKTSVLNYVNHCKQKGIEINRADVAAGFQEAAVEVLVEKSVKCAKEKGYGSLVLAGGVGANSRLRQALQQRCNEEGIKLYVPDRGLCTDNAAMIAVAAYYKYKAHGEDNLYLDADPGLSF